MNTNFAAQLAEDRSRQDGADAARRVQEAIALGNRNPIEKLFSDRDASEEMGRALTDVQARANDPAFQTAFLETLGPEGVADLESRFDDDDDFSDLVRNSLSVASNQGTLSADFQRQVVESAGLDTLERLTSDPNRPMSDDFLVAAGRRATTYGVGYEGRWLGAPGSIPVYVESVKPNADQLLVNIANSSNTASMTLLQDENFVRSALHMNVIGNAGRAGIPAILRAGTDTSLRPQNNAGVDTALRTISQVLADPKSFDVELLFRDTVVDREVADALADAYMNNAPSFSAAATREQSGSALFDQNDVRAFMRAAVQHESTRTKMSVTVQTETARLLADASQYGRGTEYYRASSIAAGNLTGVYADEYARAVLGDAARQDQRDAIVASLTAGAIQALPNFIPGANAATLGTASVAANSVSVFVEEALQGNAVDAAREALNNGDRQDQGNLEVAVLNAYNISARRALDPSANISPGERARARQFVDAIERYNATLPAGEKILNRDGTLVDVSRLDANNSRDAAIIQHISELVNPTNPNTDRTVLNQIDPTIDRINGAAGVTRENP